MTYKNALKFIEAAPSSEQKASQDALKLLFEKLGNPQNSVKFISVSGTDGKSSCISMLSSILKESGYVVGTLISPPASEYREMISVNFQTVSHSDFTEAIKTISYTIQKISEESGIAYKYSRNEIILAAATICFYKSNCQIAIIESAGGKSAPSNILQNLQLLIISNINTSIDNTSTEKLSALCSHFLFRRADEVVLGANQRGVIFKTVSTLAMKNNCRLTMPTQAEISEYHKKLSGIKFTYKSKKYEIPFSAHYELINALTAIESSYALRRRGIAVPEVSIQSGLKKAFIPFRFEILSYNPWIVIDNVNKDENISTSFASMSNLKRFIGKDIIICTSSKEFPDIDKLRVDITELCNQNFNCKSIVFLDESVSLKKDVNELIKKLKQTDTLLIFGSIHFVNKIKLNIRDFFDGT